MDSIGIRIKQLRKEIGLTQAQVGKQLDMTGSGYSSYEYNNSTPAYWRWVKLAEILHTTVQYLMTGQELSEEYAGEPVPFPVRLRELREKHHLSQSAVAKILGIAKVNYQHYERGTYEPKRDKLLKLADLFGVTLDELLGRNKQ